MNGLLQGVVSLTGGNRVLAAALMSSFAMTMTTLGSFFIFLLKKTYSERGFSLLLDTGMGFSSGVMLVASFTSLLIPAISDYGVWAPLIGFLLGALTVHVVNKLIPHEHFIKGYEGPMRGVRKLKAAWLIAFAVIIHNFPEGIAIGAASAYSIANGIATGIAIGVQDVPEGLAVSLPVYASTGKRGKALFLGFLSGFTEFVMAVIAAFLSSYSIPLLPYTMGFGAGAMVYVVSHEALPETHRTGHENLATLFFMIGFILMLLLDTLI